MYVYKRPNVQNKSNTSIFGYPSHHRVLHYQSDVSPIFFDLEQKRKLEGKGGEPVPSNIIILNKI